MNIGGINGSTISQLYQPAEQKIGGQVVQQAQSPQPQGPSEESKESAAAQNQEARSGGEASETGSINIYA